MAALSINHSRGLGLSSAGALCFQQDNGRTFDPRWWLFPCPKSFSLGGLFSYVINLATKTVLLDKHQDVGSGCLCVEGLWVTFSLVYLNVLIFV